jgi:hypothetical protein
MDRGLWLDVVKGGDEVILVNQRSRNFAVDDLQKDGFFGHDL